MLLEILPCGAKKFLTRGQASHLLRSAPAPVGGSWLAEPIADQERLLVVDIDPQAVRAARQNFDPTGHYSRPDVFDVSVDRRRREASRFVD